MGGTVLPSINALLNPNAFKPTKTNTKTNVVKLSKFFVCQSNTALKAFKNKFAKKKPCQFILCSLKNHAVKLSRKSVTDATFAMQNL